MKILVYQSPPGLNRLLISLYKAMGGGWVVAAETRVPEPPQAQKQTDG
jgi:hypothetical protein